MYHTFIKPLFFRQDPERIHHKVSIWLKVMLSTKLSRAAVKSSFRIKNKLLEKEVMGLRFKNPIGLAAGFDKDAKLFKELTCFGFGFIEVGTVTPREQIGNPTPRLFRLVEDQALINRMGFNNDGVDAMVQRLKKRSKKLIIGGNIGKNKDTPNEKAQEDYLSSFSYLFDYVDYFAINVSSPNTPNLRELQEKEPLKKLLNALQQKNNNYAKPKPIVLKIAPDLTKEQLDDIIEIVLETKLSGVIATNTTISREGLETSKEMLDKIGAGGLSGRPVKTKSTEVIRYLKQKSNNAFPVIGVGGVFTAEDAIEKLEAGADLLQIYTSFIYEGPAVVKQINKGLIQYYAAKKA